MRGGCTRVGARAGRPILRPPGGATLQIFREGHAAGELILKRGVSGEADVLDRREQRLIREQKDFCAAESGVAGGVNDGVRRFKESDAERALDLHVIAEGDARATGFRRADRRDEANAPLNKAQEGTGAARTRRARRPLRLR